MIDYIKQLKKYLEKNELIDILDNSINIKTLTKIEKEFINRIIKYKKRIKKNSIVDIINESLNDIIKLINIYNFEDIKNIKFKIKVALNNDLMNGYISSYLTKNNEEVYMCEEEKNINIKEKLIIIENKDLYNKYKKLIKKENIDINRYFTEHLLKDNKILRIYKIDVIDSDEVNNIIFEIEMRNKLNKNNITPKIYKYWSDLSENEINIYTIEEYSGEKIEKKLNNEIYKKLNVFLNKVINLNLYNIDLNMIRNKEGKILLKYLGNMYSINKLEKNSEEKDKRMLKMGLYEIEEIEMRKKRLLITNVMNFILN